MSIAALSSIAQDSFATISGFLDPELVGRLRRGDEVVVQATPDVPGCKSPHNRLARLRWHSPVVDCIVKGDRRWRVIRDFAGAGDLR